MREDAAARAEESARMEDALLDEWRADDVALSGSDDASRRGEVGSQDERWNGRVAEAPIGADRVGDMPAIDRPSARRRGGSSPGGDSTASSPVGQTWSDREDGNAGVERARKRLDTGLRSIQVAPGRAAPAAQADAGAMHFDWTYEVGGHAYACNTTVTIAPGEGLRRDAVITTMDSSGRTLVSYHGTAYRDADGLVHVDARNSPVSGPLARNWSPDSIAVDEYGQVHTQDDYNRTGGGWVTPL